MSVAAVDIGTNTVRMLVADVDGREITELDRAIEVVGLGRGLDATGAISQDSMARAVRALRGYGERIAGARRVRVVATSASRDASNGFEFTRRAEEALGAPVEVITGEAEAALSFAGAVWGLDVGSPRLVIDPGGGSTEFVLGEEAPTRVLSVDMGSVRLTDRLLPERPATAGSVERARREVDRLFAGVDRASDGTSAIGVAGTFTSLSAIHLGLEAYDRDVVHRSELPLAAIEDIVVRLARLTVEETAAIPSLDPARAPVILAGAVIAAGAVARVGTGLVTVSETDLLEGIVLGLSES